MPEGIFQTMKRIVSGLMINCFVVCPARETQDDPKDMRVLTCVVSFDNRCSAAKIYLCLFAGHKSHSTEWYRLIVSEILIDLLAG